VLLINKCYVTYGRLDIFCCRLLPPFPESAKHHVLSYWLPLGPQSSSSVDIIQCKFVVLSMRLQLKIHNVYEA
jgi:hypothetical protein